MCLLSKPILATATDRLKASTTTKDSSVIDRARAFVCLVFTFKLIMKNQSIDYLINKLLTEENKGSGRKGTSFVDVMIFGHVAFSLPLLHGCNATYGLCKSHMRPIKWILAFDLIYF